ncbi:hypothetical protein [Pleomorphovibrio marinus]|uniref:hypothetical protein n=1 Tax=Pleomorphovibrio marinus TaxID=2164132 RepID=UPI000E0B402D|nr:hypothetical protein [Pleomorphovibrio marinus]
MKKRYFDVMILIFLCCLACSEPEDPIQGCEVVPSAGDDNEIIGTWKLVSVWAFHWLEGPVEEDYSCDRIIYHFREDGILSISRDRTDDLAGGDRSDGSTYELIENTVSDFHEYTLVLGNRKLWISITDGIMELDLRAVDGPLITLIRVE